jgi:cullin 3
MTSSFIQAQVGPLGPMLYNGVTNLVIENLDRLTKEVISPNLPSWPELDPVKRRCEDEKVLEAVYNVWSDHAESVKKVSHIVKLLVCTLLLVRCHIP